MAKVTVYTTAPCGRCVNAKALLEGRGIAFEEVNLSKDPVGRGELASRTGMTTFPQVTAGDHVIGGFDDLIAADRSGRLAEIAAGARAA